MGCDTLAVTKSFLPFRRNVFSPSSWSNSRASILGLLPVKMKKLQSFETSKFVHTNTQCHSKKGWALSNIADRISRLSHVNTFKAILLCNPPLRDFDDFIYDMEHLVSCFLVFRWALKVIHSFIHSFILYSVFRQVNSLLQSGFSRQCDLVLSLSISIIIFFP